MNLTIKNVPERVRRGLKKAAAAEGRSLNTHILEVLAGDVSSRERLKRMRSARKRLEAFVTSQPYTGDLSTRLLREIRNGH